MKRIAVLLVSSVLLSACILVPQKAKYNPADVTETLVGVVSLGGGESNYSLKKDVGGIVLLHDGNASLGGFVGKKVKVVGQYSGTTLYVDSVEITK